MRSQRFTATVVGDRRRGVIIEVPFDPAATWGPKTVHHITGTVAGFGIRGAIERHGETYAFRLGPAWIRDRTVEIGTHVEVVIEPEGPQRDDLAADVAAALETSPSAATFFDALAQFYRRGYLRWIDATKRSPDLRAERIATMITLLEAGVKDYRDRDG